MNSFLKKKTKKQQQPSDLRFVLLSGPTPPKNDKKNIITEHKKRALPAAETRRWTTALC